MAARRGNRSLRILLAEDNEVNQMVFLHMLDRFGHRATAVYNGREALAALETRLFDVVLMDLQMPELDGFETVAALRLLEASQPEQQRTPVVALTAHAMAGDRERCLNAGFDAYLTKPLRMAELVRTLNDLSHRKGSSPPTMRSAGEPTTVSPVPFRADLLSESCGGCQEIIVDVIDTALSDTPRELERLLLALDRGDVAASRVHRAFVEGNLPDNRCRSAHRDLPQPGKPPGQRPGFADLPHEDRK